MRQNQSAPGPFRPGTWLLISTVSISLLGLVAELIYIFGPATPLTRKLVPFLSLSEEANLPTWYSAGLLLCAAFLLFAITRMPRQDDTKTLQWRCLALIFLFMSLDESVQLHEQFGLLFKQTSGVLYFGWVIPASIVVIAFLLLYIPFLRRLSPKYRWGFVLAGALYVGGALLMEFPLGAWAEVHGDDNPTYAMLDWVEETLEMTGASLFIWYLYQYWTLGDHRG